VYRHTFSLASRLPHPANSLQNLYSSRQGERSGHLLNSFVAHAVDLSVWQEVHGFGILYLSVISGVMNRKVCA